MRNPIRAAWTHLRQRGKVRTDAEVFQIIGAWALLLAFLFGTVPLIVLWSVFDLRVAIFVVGYGWSAAGGAAFVWALIDAVHEDRQLSQKAEAERQRMMEAGEMPPRFVRGLVSAAFTMTFGFAVAGYGAATIPWTNWPADLLILTIVFVFGSAIGRIVFEVAAWTARRIAAIVRGTW